MNSNHGNADLDIKRRYRRTMLGPFWNSATLAVYTIAVGARRSDI